MLNEWTTSGMGVEKLRVRSPSVVAGRLTLLDCGRPWLQMIDVYVEPSFRGRGLGRLLLSLAMRRALAVGKLRIRLTCDDSGTGSLLAWYSRMGYYSVGVDSQARAILESGPCSRSMVCTAAHQTEEV